MIRDNRIRIITGHYGSGKTEFAVNYAMALAERGQKVSIGDLDIVNPYFRSREKQELMEKKGISVIGSSLGNNTTADLPALSARIMSPLQDDSSNLILDVGGDDTGAKILSRYRGYFRTGEYDMFCIVNANRRETRDVEGAVKHIRSIEEATGVKVTGLVNNTHLVWETTADDVEKGNRLVREVSRRLDIPVRYTCAREELWDLLSQDEDIKMMPVNMYMREEWM